jgi:dipeptidyl aminopeptidase/acylaminoacyl peptidase
MEVLHQEDQFTTYLAGYSSDGLYIQTIINIPTGEEIHPVVIFIHGYVPPNSYYLLQDNIGMDNQLARQGFITSHPAMRNYPPSDKGDNLFRVGHAVDILNLIAIIKAQSGQPGLLEKADPAHIGIGGVSAGGGVTLRVLTVNADVKAAFLYSPISGDETRNVPLFNLLSQDSQFFGETTMPESILAKISPSSYYQYITAPVLLAHGTNDEVIPLAWSEETCAQLKNAAVNVLCNFYPGAGHSFSGANFERLVFQAIEFYNKYLY